MRDRRERRQRRRERTGIGFQEAQGSTAGDHEAEEDACCGAGGGFYGSVGGRTRRAMARCRVGRPRIERPEGEEPMREHAHEHCVVSLVGIYVL